MPRKRGHQHHIRHDGMRRSNVPADEIIAALRAGDTNPALTQATPSNANIEQTHRDSVTGMHLAVDNDNNNIYDVHVDGDVTMLNDDDNCNNNNNNNNNQHHHNHNNNNNTSSNRNNNNRSTTRSNVASRCPVSNVLADSTSEWLNGVNASSGGATGADSTSTSSQSSTVLLPATSRTSNTKLAASKSSRVSALNEMEKCASKDFDPDQTDSVSSGSSTSNKKSTKSKRDSTKKSGKSSGDPKDDGAARKEKRKRTKVLMAPPNEERPPLEGAAATDQWNEIDMADIENDPEVAEWSKLRCTSERTEVVAEREYRRQNRRCADYPGLAFGRSIFSSDTMMKLNIIRNELHNIMKTQLKRVRNTK